MSATPPDPDAASPVDLVAEPFAFTRPVQRYKLVIAYRGSRYFGWQQQGVPHTWKGPMPPKGEGLPSIQLAVSKALRTVVFHPVKLVGSSRTDTGVHAKAQVAHFDTDMLQVPPDGMRRAANHQLPDDIVIRSIEPVAPTFDAIFSTTRKRYQYLIWHALDRPVFVGDLAWHRWKELDVDAMREAARLLVGEHDFTSFAAPGHKRYSAVRTIYDCDVSYRRPRLVIGVEGNGFLWNMVRIIVGTLAEVGLGRFTPADLTRMLAARDRRAAGSTAPPHGLYLQWVRTIEGEGNGQSVVNGMEGTSDDPLEMPVD